MHIAVRSTDQQREEFEQKGYSSMVTIHWLSGHENINNVNADACFDLAFNDSDPAANKFLDQTIVFVNAVNSTCTRIGRANYVRINAWKGFLNRPVVEVAGVDDAYNQLAAETLNALGWKYVWTADDYGFISARIIAMIINEAYYALEENVSSKEQIDIALKLGTNYPYGPFEWSEKIGLENIYQLLKNLSHQDKRYSIAQTLVETFENRK